MVMPKWLSASKKVQRLANLDILLGLDSFVNVHFGITLPGTFIDKKLDQLNCPHISPHRRCELCVPQITNYRLCFMPCVFSAILTRPRLSNYRAGSLLGCRSSLVGLSRRGRLRFLTAIQHNQPDHQETCQEKDYLKSFGFAIHFGLLSKSFAELNLVQTIYDTTKPNLTSPI